MKKYFKFPVLLLLVFCTNFSCKEYLEIKSDDKLVVPSNLNDFQYLLDNAADMNYTTPCLASSSSDEYFLTDATFNTKTVFLQNVYKWVPYPYRYTNDWAYCYKSIYISNLCLERLELVERTTANAVLWDHIKGSALFFKAYYSLELAWQFAKAYDATTSTTDLGIPLRNSTDFLQPSVRSTVKQTYEKILVDAHQAALLLGTEPLITTRPSKAAAYGLLARIYLSMRDYENAFKYSDLGLKLKSELMDYNDATLVAINATSPFKIFNKEVLFHATMSVGITLSHPTSGPARIDTVLYSAYHVNDLRRKAFFTAAAPYQRFKGNYGGTTGRLFSGIATDELWLMRAECNARLGNRVSALSDLNSLLQQRFAPASFVPVTAATTAEALDIILLERRKELLFRGSLRWMDIKRLNKEGRNIVLRRRIANELFTLPANDNRYALPLPQDVLETSGMQQN